MIIDYDPARLEAAGLEVEDLGGTLIIRTPENGRPRQTARVRLEGGKLHFMPDRSRGTHRAVLVALNLLQE